MEEDSVPREGFSAGSIGSISYLCMSQSTQVTWKTPYNSALQKGYDFCIHAEILSPLYS